MSRRIEIELTSERPDGTWTWRAAGARQPKGDIPAGIVPEGVSVGDVVKADADFTIDGIDILEVITSKRVRKQPELLEIVGSGRDEPAVTTQLVERKGRRRDRDRDWNGDRDGDGDRRRRRDRSRGDGDRDRGDRGDRRPRRERAPERPRPKRLRAGKAHRSQVLDALPAEHQPIAEQVLRGGIPAVREAIAKQNEQAKKENRPEIPQDQLVDLAEKLLPQLRAAEWRDRADAALAGIDEIDLRDLRSVIVAADSAGRDPEAMAIRDQIQEGLNRRVEIEHEQWIKDMGDELEAGRFIRVLRLTSRPPKAGTPIPVDISSRLITMLTERVTAELSQDLWSQTLDALAFSPIRSSITITVRPDEPSAELMETVKKVGSRLPEIAALFGLDPAALAAESRRSRPSRQGRNKSRSKERQGRKNDAKDTDSKDAKDESVTATAAEEPAATEPPTGDGPAETAATTPADTTPAATAEPTPTDEPTAEDAAAVADGPITEPAAVEEPAATEEPAAVEEAAATEEPAATEESTSADEPAAVDGGGTDAAADSEGSAEAGEQI